MLLQRILAHGAERRGVDAVRGLRAPPHHAVVGIGAAKAVAEKSALPERRLDALADRPSVEQRARHEAAEADQPGVERFWPVRNHMRAHHRMHAVGTDQEIAFGRGAVGEMGDDRLVGAVLDARPGASRNAARRSRTRPCRSGFRSAWRGRCSPRAGRNARFMLRLIEPSRAPDCE